MKKLILILFVSFLFFSCAKNSSNLKEESKSWGTEYTWTCTDSNGDLVFYTLMQCDAQGNTFFIQSNYDYTTHKFNNVKEFKNATLGAIERTSGKITAITVNNIKYKF